MPFCTACGANVEPSAGACPRCGAATGVPQAQAQPSAGTPAAPAGSSAVKIILIVFGVIILAGVLGAAVIGYIGYRFARDTRVTTGPEGETRVETPFGRVETSRDPEKVAEQLEVEVYPGAEPAEDSGSVSMGDFQATAATFTSDDSPEEVAEFYRERYPKATVTTHEGRHTLVQQSEESVLTIHIEPAGEGSRIHVSRVEKPS